MTILGKETVWIQHQSVSAVDGEYGLIDDGAAFDLTASVQPILGELVELIPEAARVKARYVMIIEGRPDIRVSDLNGRKISDRVTYRGEYYRIGKILDWTGHQTGIPHFASTLEKIGDDE